MALSPPLAPAALAAVILRRRRPKVAGAYQIPVASRIIAERA